MGQSVSGYLPSLHKAWTLSSAGQWINMAALNHHSNPEIQLYQKGFCLLAYDIEVVDEAFFYRQQLYEGHGVACSCDMMVPRHVYHLGIIHRGPNLYNTDGGLCGMLSCRAKGQNAALCWQRMTR
jgi:hypothetical protein